MKFTDSPVIELTVTTNTTTCSLSFVQDNSTMHVGTSVWPCSLVLAKFVDRWVNSGDGVGSPYAELLRFDGKRGVELGSGCGPSGIALAALGLDVVLTDVAPVMPALRQNLKRNRSSLPRPLPRIVQLYWQNPAQIQALKPPFDLVIAADVVYLEDGVHHLVDAMHKLVKEEGAVLLGYQMRSPEADRLFWELVRRVFPVVEKVPQDDLHPDYAYEETDVYIFRKRR